MTYNIEEFRYDNENKILFGLIDYFIVDDRIPGKLINVIGKTKTVVFQHFGDEYSKGTFVAYNYKDLEKLGIKLKFINNSYKDDKDVLIKMF